MVVSDIRVGKSTSCDIFRLTGIGRSGGIDLEVYLCLREKQFMSGNYESETELGFSGFLNWYNMSKFIFPIAPHLRTQIRMAGRFISGNILSAKFDRC